MRANLVGKSVVSAITQTPASGPLGPFTTPPMSWGPTFCANAVALTAAAASNAKSLFMVSSSGGAGRIPKKNGTRGSRFFAAWSGLNRRHARAAAAAVAHDERHDKRDQEEEEEHLSYSCSRAGNAGKAEECRDDRDDEEPDCPAKHLSLQRLCDNRQGCKRRAGMASALTASRQVRATSSAGGAIGAKGAATGAIASSSSSASSSASSSPSTSSSITESTAGLP